MKLYVVVGSTRPNRMTLRLARWVAKEAEKLDATAVTLVDLADYSMPYLDEPASPRHNPQREFYGSVKKWLDTMADADAYVFVTPEYNHSIPGVLKNAIDYLTFEMVHKPATVVSHGTVGGARATMHLKEILSESRAAVVPYAVAFPGAGQHLDEDGTLDATVAEQAYGPLTSLRNALEDLKWYSDALSAARNEVATAVEHGKVLASAK